MGWSGNAQCKCRHIVFSSSHHKQRPPGRYDHIMRHRAPKMTHMSADMKQFGCRGCWMPLFHVNKVWNELWKWAGDTGRETAGVSVDKHWRGRGSCGGCASSKLPSQKMILFLSFFFIPKVQPGKCTQTVIHMKFTHRDPQFFVQGPADGCHLANPSADVANRLKTELHVRF